MREQVCENCGKANADDAAYCYACGHILPAGLAALTTHSLQDVKRLKPQLRWGTAYFGEQSVMRVHIRHTGATVDTRFQKECVIGRGSDDDKPDLDLSPFGAIDMGVSRRHVLLTRQSSTIMVQDLGSRNGTFLNGQRLLPNQPRVLRNEDELALGHLVLRVSFFNLNQQQD